MIHSLAIFTIKATVVLLLLNVLGLYALCIWAIFGVIFSKKHD